MLYIYLQFFTSRSEAPSSRRSILVGIRPAAAAFCLKSTVIGRKDCPAIVLPRHTVAMTAVPPTWNRGVTKQNVFESFTCATAAPSASLARLPVLSFNPEDSPSPTITSVGHLEGCGLRILVSIISFTCLNFSFGRRWVCWKLPASCTQALQAVL